MSVLELEGDPEVVTSTIAAEAAAAITQDGAEVIVLGCGGMAGLDAKIRELTGAPTVDGVAAAVKLAEDFVQLGLTTSKVRTYATPRKKVVRHWPLHASLSTND